MNRCACSGISSIRFGSPILRPDYVVPFVIPRRLSQEKEDPWLPDDHGLPKSRDQNAPHPKSLDNHPEETSSCLSSCLDEDPSCPRPCGKHHVNSLCAHRRRASLPLDASRSQYHKESNNPFHERSRSSPANLMVPMNQSGQLINPVKRIREDLNKESREIQNPARIQLSLCYNPQQQTLEVTIVRVVNLPRWNIFGMPDSAVKVEVNQVVSDKLETVASKTKIERWNANPVYKEMFSFPVSNVSNLHDGMYLTCTVVRQGHWSRGRGFGAIGLGLASTQDSERSHWAKTLATPGHPCTRWHRLIRQK